MSRNDSIPDVVDVAKMSSVAPVPEQKNISRVDAKPAAFTTVENIEVVAPAAAKNPDVEMQRSRSAALELINDADLDAEIHVVPDGVSAFFSLTFRATNWNTLFPCEITKCLTVLVEFLFVDAVTMVRTLLPMTLRGGV